MSLLRPARTVYLTIALHLENNLFILAIYTLLQPPIVRSGLIPYASATASNAYKLPTARDIPPVTLSPLPKVDTSKLKPYLSQLEVLYNAMQRAKENEEEDTIIASRKTSRSDGSTDNLDQVRRHSSRSSNSRQSSIASRSSFETVRKRSTAGRRAANVLTPLSTVPNVFFEENFHLENPRTFDIVSEHSELVKQNQAVGAEQQDLDVSTSTPRKALATNAILQEKLSWYMDTVESHLVNSISSASKSFFAALGSLRELHLEASMSVNRIKTLRRDLLLLDKDMAIGGLKILNMKQRKDNLRDLSDTIHQLQIIVETIAKCDSLIGDGDVEKALDTIDYLVNLISGEGPVDETLGKIRDLRGATSLKGIENDTDTLRYRIGKIFEVRFLEVLMNDLKPFTASASASDTIQRWSLSSQRTRVHNGEHSPPAYLKITAGLRSELTTSLKGLYRARHISPATSIYRESILREVRNIIRRQLPASSDDDIESLVSTSTADKSKNKTQQEKMSILARNLRSMDPEEGEDLLKRIYIPIGETLRRLSTQGKVLLDITSTYGERLSPSSPRSPTFGAIDERIREGTCINSVSRESQQEIHLSLNMSDLVGQAVDIAQDKIVKLLRVRSEQTIHLSVHKFLRYFTLNLLFANECEAVSGRSGTSLKNVVNGHIKDFTRQLGESQRQSLAAGMEADSWNIKDFNEADDEILSRIISSSTEDVVAWKSGCNVWFALTSSDPDIEPKKLLNEENFNPVAEKSTPAKTNIRPAKIGNEPFNLPNSAILCLHGLSSFLHLGTGIPSMGSEIASTILSYLSLFNSRCTQLILGAGATRSAGLKNITTKHLALASQALSFISTLIPHIQEFVRRHNSPSNPTLIGEFDKIKRAYLEHQNSIHDKLVDIMAGRTIAHTKTMRSIDWSNEREGVSPYMEMLTKETSTLHRVLSRHLPVETVGMIMQSVLENYKEQWIKAFGEVVLVSESARER